MDGKKLDQFRPAAETFYGVKRQLITAGIEPNSIPDEWLAAIIAAMTKWQSQTSEGLAFVINSLNFQWTKGKEELRYDYHAPDGSIYTIAADKINFFAGASIAGKPINPSHMVISKKMVTTCDSCGGSAHCVKAIRNPSTDRLESFCNGCLLKTDNMKMKEQASHEVCNNCTVNTCHHKEYKLLTGTRG